MSDDIEAELFEVFGEHRADDSTISKVRTLIAWHREEVDFIGQIELLLGLDGDPGEIPNAIRKLIEERDHLRARVAELEVERDTAREAYAALWVLMDQVAQEERQMTGDEAEWFYTGQPEAIWDALSPLLDDDARDDAQVQEGTGK